MISAQKRYIEKMYRAGYDIDMAIYAKRTCFFRRGRSGGGVVTFASIAANRADCMANAPFVLSSRSRKVATFFGRAGKNGTSFAGKQDDNGA